MEIVTGSAITATLESSENELLFEMLQNVNDIRNIVVLIFVLLLMEVIYKRAKIFKRWR